LNFYWFYYYYWPKCTQRDSWRFSIGKF